MKIKKLKIKLNKDNEYSDYRYFIPKSNNIKMTDGRDVDEAVQSLKDKIANLKEQANYLINKAPLVKYAEGTSITAINCTEAPLKKLAIEGDSYQATSTGVYNLIDEIEVGGINYNTGILEDNFSAIRSKNYIPIDTTITYCFSRNVDKVTTAVGLRFYDIDYTYLGSAQVAENVASTVFKLAGTAKADAKYLKFTVATTIIDGDYMLTEGDIVLPYEKYGKAPSFDYAAYVDSVGDNINLFNKENETVQLINYQTGSIASNAAWRLSEYIPVTQFTNYTLSWDSTHQYFQARIHMFDKQKQFLYGARYELSNTYQKTFITCAECAYIRLNYSVEVSGQEAIRSNIKLEPGIKKTAYSPYLCGSVKIYNSNINLLYQDGVQPLTINGVSFTPQEDGGILINGAASANANFPILGKAWGSLDKKIIFQKNKKYTIGKGTPNAIIYCRDAIKNINNATPLSGIKVIENMSCITYAYIQVQKDHIVNNEIIYPMIIEDEYDIKTFPTYIKNQGQILNLYTQEPLKRIASIKDRFIKINDDWYEEHNIDKIILNGTQTVHTGNAATQTDTIYVVFSHINEGLVASELNCLCENLPAYSASYLWTNDIEGIGQSQSQIVLRLGRNIANSIEEVKTFIQAHPITIYARRVEPRLIPCTAEQSAVLNNINSFYKQTYITVEELEHISANLKIAYKQDIDIIIKEGV